MAKSVSHPISTLDQYQPSGLYWSLGLIWGVIQILPCIILYICYVVMLRCVYLFIKDFKIIVFVLYNRVQTSAVDATTTTASATGKVIYSLR